MRINAINNVYPRKLNQATNKCMQQKDDVTPQNIQTPSFKGKFGAF